MNILFLSSWYPTTKNPNFGVFVKEHAHAIHAVGNNVVVVALSVSQNKQLFSASFLDFHDENNVRTIQVELQSRFKDLLYHLLPVQYFYLKKALKLCEDSGFIIQIVHSNVIFPAGILGDWLAAKLKKPHVITEHWSRIEGFTKMPVWAEFGVKSYVNAAKILPVSLFLQRRIQKILPELNDDKFQVVGNVIDSNTFTFKPKVSKVNELNFCAIATWANKKIADKLPELFIEAIAKLQMSIDSKITLTMIGGGDKIETLKKFCELNNVNAIFTSYLPKAEIVKHLQNADFMLHASTVETFGVVVAEALMCGTPVVCSRVGALPNLVDASNAVLCNNTVEEWVEALKTAISMEFDHKSIAQNINDKYSLNAIGNQYSKIYKGLI